jgi:hypothetical protein
MHSQVVLSPMSLLVQEGGELAELNSIEKWFNNHQSLWAFLYFCQFKLRVCPVGCADLFAVRHCEQSLASTINAVAKESKQTRFKSLIKAYQDGRRIMLYTRNADYNCA